MTTATSTHTAPLTKREEITEGTMAFHFAKPADFQFRAGQSMDLTLVNPPETDAEGNTRTFSIASAPFDSDLMIATRMRNTAFKRVLRNAALGLQVRIAGPSGSFVLLRKAEKQAVFLAGGIGITPFLSIIRQAEHDKSAASALPLLRQPAAGRRSVSRSPVRRGQAESEFPSDCVHD